LQNLPLESSCVIVALIENYSTSKPLKVSPEKSHVLSCDTVVAYGRYVNTFYTFKCHAQLFHTFLLEEIMRMRNERMWFCAACGYIQAALVDLAVFLA
jgi:hypothetical protein